VIKLPVDDHDEVQFSRWIMRLFERSDEIDEALAPLLDPHENSSLCRDDTRIPNFPVSGYAVGQLSVASGCIASLKQMMIRESETTIDMLASPFGAYTLVRNALDAAVVALWLLEPVNGTLRIKRRIMLGVDEIGKSAAFREAMGQPSTKEKRRARMQEVAGLAGLGTWNPLSKNSKLPSTTQMLTDLERWHSNTVIPWLAAWQLASGHAHGKLWAQVASHELQEVEGTRTETGAHFQMTIHYGMLAAVLFEAVQLLEVAGRRYQELCGLTSKSI
jgi:hypothetical protein